MVGDRGWGAWGGAARRKIPVVKRCAWVISSESLATRMRRETFGGESLASNDLEVGLAVNEVAGQRGQRRPAATACPEARSWRHHRRTKLGAYKLDKNHCECSAESGGRARAAAKEGQGAGVGPIAQQAGLPCTAPGRLG